ncbi:hypothetical protein AB0C13_30220 [Streptomyces sp. NPDC049099]
MQKSVQSTVCFSQGRLLMAQVGEEVVPGIAAGPAADLEVGSRTALFSRA